MKFRKQEKCPALVGFSIKGEAKLIRCGKWSCPKCRKHIARKWAMRVKIHITDDKAYTGNTWYFLTVTLGRGEKDVYAAYKKLKKLWNRLRMHINRETGKVWQYCAFVEGQPKRDNMPHFHIILNYAPRGCYGKRGKITEHATHDWAWKMGWGYEAKIEPVESDRAAWYVSKYTSKGGVTVPKGFRRVRTSKRWTRLPKDPARYLIVQAKDENLTAYFDRVNCMTGVEMEELHERWEIAQERLEDEQSIGTE